MYILKRDILIFCHCVCLDSAFASVRFLFFFFMHVFHYFKRHKILFMEPITILFKKNTKNGFHSIIYIFKNYFIKYF